MVQAVLIERESGLNFHAAQLFYDREKYDRDGLADQLLGRRAEVEEQGQGRQDSIKF